MRKTELLETINNQKKQIENVMDIFKVLAEGGDIAVHIYKKKEPSYFVTPKGSTKSNFEICSGKIFEGLYSRGLLIVTGESFYEDFAVQHYALRAPKKQVPEGD